MIVRPRDAGDLPALVTALRAVHDRDGYPVRWKADPAVWLSPDGLRAAWVVEHDARPVGRAALAAVEHARAEDRTAVLEVSPADVPALVLYGRHGWRDAGAGPARWWVPGGGPSLLLAAPA